MIFPLLYSLRNFPASKIAAGIKFHNVLDETLAAILNELAALASLIRFHGLKPSGILEGRFHGFRAFRLEDREIRDTGVSFLLVEHAMRAVMRLSDRIVVLDGGKVIATGLPSKIACDPCTRLTSFD